MIALPFRAIVSVPGEPKTRQTFEATLNNAMGWIRDHGTLPEGTVVQVWENVEKSVFYAVVKVTESDAVPPA